MTHANSKREVENKEVDFWIELPEHVKYDVESAIKESNLGWGKTHQAVMFEYQKWVAI